MRTRISVRLSIFFGQAYIIVRLLSPLLITPAINVQLHVCQTLFPSLNDRIRTSVQSTLCLFDLAFNGMREQIEARNTYTTAMSH